MVTILMNEGLGKLWITLDLTFKKALTKKTHLNLGDVYVKSI